MIISLLRVLYAPIEAINSQIYIGLINQVYPPEVAQAYIGAREKAEQILVV